MDLKSILSPSEEKPQSQSSQAQTSRSIANRISTPPAPALVSQSPTSNPHKYLERAHSGPAVAASRNAVTHGVSKHAAAVGSPLAQTPLSSLPSHVISPLHQAGSSPLISPVPTTPGSPHALRSLSGQPVDTLGDLAGLPMQPPHGCSRPSPLQNPSVDSARSDSSGRMVLAQTAMSGHHRASIDINMLETSQEKRRTDFSNTHLKDEDKDRLAQLSSYLAEHPSAYESHVAYIALLHQAFISYVYPSSQSDDVLPPKQNPASFELLTELENARTTMEKLFAVGETTWLDWLQDASMLAQATEERINVVEKFRQAVDEEVGSCKLWVAYGDWVHECHKWATQYDDTDDEDRLVGREVFTSELVLETWQSAVESTKQDLAQSHLVWNKYIGVLIADFATNPTKERATALLGMFEQRLRTPHIAYESTKQLLSSFMNAHFSQEQYFEIMEDTPRIMKDALRLLEDRSGFERTLEEAQAASVRDAEYNAFATYITWEKTPAKRKRLDFESCNALYQRAELRFPSDHNLWEDHISFALENGRSALDLLKRATKHCPWSGALWSQYLLASDRQGLSYEQTESIKHQATSTGVLEAAGMNEVIKIYAAWCSYLRRRAFRPDHDEDDADIAEMGFRTSMENLKDLGVKLGLGDVPDPTFRLQRIYINFLSESGRWDNARQQFDDAVAEYGKSWQFWLTFYHWEMRRWRVFAPKSRDEENVDAESAPHLATAVLKAALDQEHLDYPEPVIEMMLSHSEDYEDADEIQTCLLKARKVEQALSARRQIEALQQAQLAAANTVPEAVEDTDSITRPTLSKRKREFNDSDETLMEVTKKSKIEDEEPAISVEQNKSEELKRDREHATVLVENLPDHVEQSKVRQYFSNCGTVKSLKILENNTSAIIEFEDADAAQYALSRDGQQFEDAILSVVLDTGSTVFLTNYAPETSESDVRSLLEPHGEIVSIRFPSLQGNKRRRFCYVQFKFPSEAQSAVDGLDNKDINGLSLTCKISNPAVKKSRQETSVNDGSTIFIGSLNFKTTEEEVKKEFEQFGDIQLVRMPLHETMKNRNKGIAFVTFATTSEAQAALAMNGKPVKGRNIKVEIAQDNQGRTKRGSSLAVSAKNADLGRSSSPTVVAIEPRSERTVFLTSVPDTLNEARLAQVASKFGEVVKVVLKTNHQGALVEYGDIASAGKANLALDGYEIDPGRKLKVVSEKEMLSAKPAQRTDDFAARPKPKGAASLPIGSVIKRPTQPGNRGRKGGNIGQRSAMLHTSNISHQPEKDATIGNGVTDADHTSTPKSNADFRAIMKGSE